MALQLVREPQAPQQRTLCLGCTVLHCTSLRTTRQRPEQDSGAPTLRPPALSHSPEGRQRNLWRIMPHQAAQQLPCLCVAQPSLHQQGPHLGGAPGCRQHEVLSQLGDPLVKQRPLPLAPGPPTIRPHRQLAAPPRVPAMPVLWGWSCCRFGGGRDGWLRFPRTVGPRRQRAWDAGCLQERCCMIASALVLSAASCQLRGPCLARRRLSSHRQTAPQQEWTGRPPAQAPPLRPIAMSM